MAHQAQARLVRPARALARRGKGVVLGVQDADPVPAELQHARNLVARGRGAARALQQRRVQQRHCAVDHAHRVVADGVQGAPAALQLPVDGVHGAAVLLLARDLVQGVEGLAGVDVVQVELVGVVALNGAVLAHEVVDERVRKVQILAALGDAVQLYQRLDHAAVDVVPGVGPPGANLLDVPRRRLRRAGLDQLVDVAVENGVATHAVLLSKCGLNDARPSAAPQARARRRAAPTARPRRRRPGCGRGRGRPARRPRRAGWSRTGGAGQGRPRAAGFPRRPAGGTPRAPRPPARRRSQGRAGRSGDPARSSAPPAGAGL